MKFTKIYLHCEQENKDSTQGYVPTHIFTRTHHTHTLMRIHILVLVLIPVLFDSIECNEKTGYCMQNVHRAEHKM